MSVLEKIWPWSEIAWLKWARDIAVKGEGAADAEVMRLQRLCSSLNYRVRERDTIIASLRAELAEVRQGHSDKTGEMARTIDERDSTIREIGIEYEKIRAEIEFCYREAATLRAQIAKFDHDGDGKPGGSKSKKKIT